MRADVRVLKKQFSRVWKIVGGALIVLLRVGDLSEIYVDDRVIPGHAGCLQEVLLGFVHLVEGEFVDREILQSRKKLRIDSQSPLEFVVGSSQVSLPGQRDTHKIQCL